MSIYIICVVISLIKILSNIILNNCKMKNEVATDLAILFGFVIY